MKKIMSLMLGLSLVLGAATVAFAQDTKDSKSDTKKSTKGKKKGTKDTKTTKSSS